MKLRGLKEDFEEEANKSLNFPKLLFSSMLTSAELYLSNNLPKIKNTIKKTKSAPINLLKRIKNIQTIAKSGGIEKLLVFPSFQNIMPFNKKLQSSKSDSKILRYNPKINENSAKKALRHLYAGFLGYNLKGYDANKRDYKAINKNKVAGFVKYSMEKYLKVFQYVLAMAMPQWNMPWGSKNDYDTLAHTVSPNSSVDDESLKYNFAYSSLRYRIY